MTLACAGHPAFCVEIVYTLWHSCPAQRGSAAWREKARRRGRMRFTEQLHQQAAAVREQVFHHPFVTGIGDGTLPLAAFRYYMCQDYVFLIDYCRVLALAVAKADDLETMGRFAALLHATLHTEMALHRDFATQFGISEAELEATQD